MTFALFIVGFILIWVLFSKIRTLSERLDRLEARKPSYSPMEVDTDSVTAPIQTEPVVSASIVPPVSAPFAPPPSSPTVASAPFAPVEVEEGPRRDPFRWFKEHTLIKIGAFIFFLGAVWFVSYAISQGWISPFMRIVAGILLGAIIGAGGQVLRAKNQQHYLVLTVLGAAIIFASVYAGQFLFSLFSPLLAMVMLLLTIAYVVYVAVNTGTEWLGVIAALALLVAPLLINSPDQPVLFFFYLFVASAGLSVVVLKTAWRAVSSTLLVGVVLYLLLNAADNSMADETLWFFTVIFSLLFFVVTTLSLFRTRVPHSADLTNLGIISIVFLVFAYEIGLIPSLAAFVSMAVVAGTGYYFHLVNLPTRIQAVYAGIALLHLFVGTAFLLDGFTLTIAYAAEVTLLLSTALYLRLSRRMVTVSAWLVLIPIISSFSSITARAWDTGVWHVHSFTLLILTGALMAVAVWSFILLRRGYPAWQLSLSGWYGLLGYGYFLLVTSLMFSASSLTYDLSEVFVYLTWTAAAIFVLLVIDQLQLPKAWRVVILVSLLLPMAASLRSMTSNAWNGGILHADMAGLCAMTLAMGAIAMFNLRRFLQLGEMFRLHTAGWFLGVTYLYLVIVIALVAEALFSNGTTVNVVRMVGWTFVSYAFSTILFYSTVPTRWVLAALLTLLLPGLVALSLLIDGGWSGPLAIEAVGLYFTTAILFFLGTTFLRELPFYAGDRVLLRAAITPLFTVAALMAVRIVWLLAHSIIDENDYAVMVSLLVYTVAGLALYLLGSARSHRHLKLAGSILLIGVVLRLLLVEVWVMEVFWRIITFLAVGALFIAAALLERKDSASGTPTAPTGQTPTE